MGGNFQKCLHRPSLHTSHHPAQQSPTTPLLTMVEVVVALLNQPPPSLTMVILLPLPLLLVLLPTPSHNGGSCRSSLPPSHNGGHIRRVGRNSARGWWVAASPCPSVMCSYILPSASARVFSVRLKKSWARFNNEPGFPIGQGTSLSSNVEDTLSVVLRSMNVGKQATPRETLLLNNKQE